MYPLESLGYVVYTYSDIKFSSDKKKKKTSSYSQLQQEATQKPIQENDKGNREGIQTAIHFPV